VRVLFFSFFSLAALCGLALAAEPPEGSPRKSVEPYIDELKQGMEKKGQEKPALEPAAAENPEPYIQSQKKKLQQADAEAEGPPPENGSYIDAVKKENPAAFSDANPGSYTAQEKAKLDPKAEGGAIQAVSEGRSELHARQKGEIHRAFGFRYGAALTRNISAIPSLQLRAFNDIYGNSYAPDLSLFYEWQPIHSETYGNIGLMGSFGVGYFHGYGNFKVQLVNGATGAPFPTTSQTKFQFFTAPAILALDYRFNLFHYFRPFVVVGPALIGYYEARNDDQAGSTGKSIGLYDSLGVSVLLDWLSPSNSWDLYTQMGVNHYYLTFEYSDLNTLSGDVSVQSSGLNVGLTYEF